MSLQRHPTPALRLGRPIAWEIAGRPVDYLAAVERMEAEAAAIATGTAPERVWLLEHPPLYTAGTSADDGELLAPGRFPVHRTGRGGRFTYHGPGQRVAYVMLDLKARGGDIRAFVCGLEDWIIATLAAFDVRGERRADRVGVWVARPDKGPGVEDKIAAIGVRVRKWVSFHGTSLNVAPDLEHFSGIVPCGIAGHGITSLHDLGHVVTMSEVDGVLRQAFEAVFGETV